MAGHVAIRRNSWSVTETFRTEIDIHTLPAPEPLRLLMQPVTATVTRVVSSYGVIVCRDKALGILQNIKR